LKRLKELVRFRLVRVKFEDVIIPTSLALVFIAALMLRLLRLDLGIYLLDEFDPYFQYWMAKYVVERGWGGFVDWFSWFKDLRFWYPHGRDVVHTAFPGLAFTAAFIYLLLSSIGLKLSLMEVCILLPPFMGALTAVSMYFLGKEVESKAAGLYAAVFMSFISPSFYLSRTLLGFFDDESVGIFAMVCALIFYVRALRKDGRLLDAALSGLFLGYMAATWGAATYIVNLIAAHAIVVVLLGRYTRKLLYTYSATMSVALLIISFVPKHGPGFLFSGLGFLAIAAYALLVLAEALSFLKPRERRLISCTIVIVLVLGLVGLWYAGLVTAPERYFSVFNPAIRSPLVSSVSEHQAVTWAYFLSEYQLTLLLAFLGLFFIIKRGDDVDVLLALMTCVTFYAAASMARLMALLAPLIALLGGLALSRLIQSLISSFRVKETPRRRIKYTLGLSRPLAGLSLALLVISFTPIVSPFVQPLSMGPHGLIARARSPPIIATSVFSVSFEIPDWLNTLAWMRENLPANAVVASWWDYGYHIAIIGNRSSTCDNAALDYRQIAKIATAFLSNETVALRIFKELGVTHVVVFGYVAPLELREGPIVRRYWVSYGSMVGDDVVKSGWMASIAGLDPSDYLGTTVFRDPSTNMFISLTLPSGEKAEDAVLYRMIFNNYEEPLSRERGPIIKNIRTTEDFVISGVEEFHVKPLQHFKLVYASEPNRFVLVYEVVYD